MTKFDHGNDGGPVLVLERGSPLVPPVTEVLGPCVFHRRPGLAGSASEDRKDPGLEPTTADGIMRTHARLLGYVILAASLGGCATLLPGSRESPERVADRALEALEHGDYAAAMADLTWVSTYHLERAAGRYSLLALAAAELDPANPERRPEVGRDLLTEYRVLTENPKWTVPVANAFHRLAFELEDTSERAERAERERDRAMAEARRATGEAREAQEERGSLQGRVSQLERQLEASLRETAEARRELARMRRALGG